MNTCNYEEFKGSDGPGTAYFIMTVTTYHKEDQGGRNICLDGSSMKGPKQAAGKKDQFMLRIKNMYGPIPIFADALCKR